MNRLFKYSDAFGLKNWQFINMVDPKHDFLTIIPYQKVKVNYGDILLYVNITDDKHFHAYLHLKTNSYIVLYEKQVKQLKKKNILKNT